MSISLRRRRDPAPRPSRLRLTIEDRVAAILAELADQARVQPEQMAAQIIRGELLARKLGTARPDGDRAEPHGFPKHSQLTVALDDRYADALTRMLLEDSDAHPARVPNSVPALASRILTEHLLARAGSVRDLRAEQGR